MPELQNASIPPTQACCASTFTGIWLCWQINNYLFYPNATCSFNMPMELQSIRHIICLQFCVYTQHPYFHPASLVLLTNFHPASRRFPPSIPAKNTTLVSNLLGHITSSYAVNHDKSTNFVRIPDQICVKQDQCCQLACHKIATYRAPPCLMLGGIPPASLSEG